MSSMHLKIKYFYRERERGWRESIDDKTRIFEDTHTHTHTKRDRTENVIKHKRESEVRRYENDSNLNITLSC